MKHYDLEISLLKDDNDELAQAAKKLAEMTFKCGWTMQADWEDVGKAMDELAVVMRRQKLLTKKPKWQS